MKYTIEKIKQDYNEGKNMNYTFFWKVGSSFGYLSQWWKYEFTIDNVTYICCEQYMMAEKARLFNDEHVLKEIMKTNNPNEMKSLGRKIKNFDPEIWNKNCFEIVKRGNYAKFSQNEKLKSLLINHTNDILVEASPLDKIWGIGLDCNDKNAKNPNLWNGTNLLGFALMEVKDDLIG